MQIEMWLSLTVCANIGLVSWPGHCRLWIRVLFSYTVWLLSVYLVSYCSNHLEAKGEQGPELLKTGGIW